MAKNEQRPSPGHGLVKRVRERMRLAQIRMEIDGTWKKPKREPRPTLPDEWWAGEMQYRIKGSRNRYQLTYKLSNGAWVRHCVALPEEECHRAALCIYQEVWGSPGLEAELAATITKEP